MLAWLNLYFVPLAAKLCLVGMFPVSGVDKIMHWDAAMGQAKSSPVLAPGLLLALGCVVELVTPVCIVLGWHGRLAAFILAGFCVVTAILYHPFWKFANFWNPDDLLGLVLIGGNPVPVAAVISAPSSSMPAMAVQQP
jgi:putative oxidoreductase